SLWPGTLRAEGPAVYTRETLSFCRVDPATGRALWACPLGLGQVCVIAAGGESQWRRRLT
ncbi:MAG: hypothetical protein NTW87_10060, partial [Planctomycetota bacterium]|nr:hypothetical protein [Planctomycetota bacterium]